MSNLPNLQQNFLQVIRQEKARREFWDFCLYYDEDFFTKRNFLKEIADAFSQVHRKEIKSLSVSMPPRAGKSYITSLFAAWTLANKPTESVMRNTCTASLYDKFSYDTRAIVKSIKFQEVFPEIKLAEDKQNLAGWRLQQSKQVGYFGAGVGGTIIGFGASALAMTDDLYRSYEEALSDTINEKVQMWKQSAHDSRLETGCPTIDIGTRWSKKDVIGINMEAGRYEKSIVVPALINGKSFCEYVKTTAEYLKIKSEIDSTIFSAEYLQQPIESKGMLFNLNEFNYFKPDKNIKYESSIAYIDVADEGADYLAMAIGKNIGEKLHIPKVVFNKDNADVTVELCAEAIRREGVSYCRVEANSMGAMFARNLQRLVPSCSILSAHSTTNKHTRIIMDAGFIKKYFYFMEKGEQDNEYSAFLNQVGGYYREQKNTKHDDAPDCLSGLAIFARTMLSHYY